MHGILCFGDSLTFGVGEQPCRGWCGRLKDWFELQGSHNIVYNLGVPGDSSLDLLERFSAEAKRVKIKREGDKFLIIIAIGTNDSKWDGMPDSGEPRCDEADFRDAILKLITKAKDHTANLVFLGLPPVNEKKTQPFEETSFRNDRVKLFNDIVRYCCEENHVLFLDLFTELVKVDYHQLLGDGLHLNTKGYETVFAMLQDFLEANNLVEL